MTLAAASTNAEQQDSEHHAVCHADGLVFAHLPFADRAERARHQRNLASPAQMLGDAIALEDKAAARQSHLTNEPVPAFGFRARHRAAALGRIRPPHRRASSEPVAAGSGASQRVRFSSMPKTLQANDGA